MSKARTRFWSRCAGRAALFLGALLAAAASAQTPTESGQQLLAVLELKNKLPNRKLIDASYLTDAVRTAALHAAPDLHVITRENLLVILAATGKNLADCEGECEVETARNVGADFVITGEVLKVGSRYKLVLRLHETRLGSLVSGTQASGRTIDALDGGIHKAVTELLVQFKRPSIEDPPQAPPPPRGTRLPAVDSQRLESEAIANLKAFFTAEKNFYSEKDRYTNDVKMAGFEPSPWCEDGSRNEIPEPAEKNRARGCHFTYEVKEEGKSFLLFAHGAVSASRGMEFQLDLEGPQQGIPRRLDR